MAKFKPKKFLYPNGTRDRIAQRLGLAPDTVGKCLNGHISGVCSQDTARLIYSEAYRLGAYRIKYS